MTIVNPDTASSSIAVYSDSIEYRKLMKAATMEKYLQLSAKAILLFFGLFMFIIVFKAFYRDIQDAIEHNRQTARIEQNQCLQDYKNNHCDDPTIPFKLQKICQKWKICIETTPTGIGSTKITARFIAQFINDLVEPLSAKAVSILVLCIAGYIMIMKQHDN